MIQVYWVVTLGSRVTDSFHMYCLHFQDSRTVLPYLLWQKRGPLAINAYFLQNTPHVCKELFMQHIVKYNICPTISFS